MAMVFSKGLNVLKNTADKVGEGAKKASDTAKTKANALAIAAKDKGFQSRLKKYAPLFPDEFLSGAFKVPNLIRIVDDAVRKGIDVCEGAIGWLSKEKGVEVFHLYDEALALSGLQFLPAPICDSIYFVDPFNPSLFISIENYFSYIQQAKIAELQHIAFALGVKHYVVEIIELTNEKSSVRMKASANKKNVASAESTGSLDTRSSMRNTSLAEGSFSGSDKPSKPNLRWFSNDNNVKNLIDMRCSGSAQSSISTYSIELSNSSNASISRSTAISINAVAGNFGVKSNFDGQSEREHNSKLLFKLQF